MSYLKHVCTVPIYMICVLGVRVQHIGECKIVLLLAVYLLHESYFLK